MSKTYSKHRIQKQISKTRISKTNVKNQLQNKFQNQISKMNFKSIFQPVLALPAADSNHNDLRCCSVQYMHWLVPFLEVLSTHDDVVFVAAVGRGRFCAASLGLRLQLLVDRVKELGDVGLVVGFVGF